MAGMVVGAIVSSFVAPAVAGAVATTAFAAGVTGLAYAGTYMAVEAATTAVVGSVVSSAFAGGGGGPAPSAVSSQQARGMLINAASSIDPLPVIYGSRRVGGTYVMPPSVSGTNNEYLHLVIAICESQISAINTVYLDDVATTDARFTDLVTVEKFLGTDTQAASAMLIEAFPDKWTSAHQGKGVAYLHVRLRYDANVFHGIPVVTCDIDGRVLYDPRTGLTAFSNNPALCQRNYLTNTRYGRGIPSGLIDDASFIVAANHCDEMVAIPGGTQKRYTCDGAVNVDDTIYANTKRLHASCRGMIVFSGGDYKLVIDKQETPLDFTFNEDNITGAWEITRPGKRDIVNKVSASFFNPDNAWQPDIAIADSTAYRAQDNGLLLERKIDLPYTANTYRAGHLSQLELKSTRFATAARFNAFQEGLRCEVGDVVKITHSTPGWANKPFRVMTIDILDSDDVSVTVREYDDSAYTLDALSAVATAPQTTLPDPFIVGSPSVLAVAVENITQPDGTIIPRLVASWTAATDPFVVGYEVAVREDGGPWDTSTSSSTRRVIPASVVGRTYDVRIRSINSMGIRGAWVALNGTVSTAPSVAPAAPTATVTGRVFSVHVQWAFGDARQDIRGTEVWWSATNDRASAVRLTREPFPALEYNHVALSPAQSCYYWLRVVDTYDNISTWYPSSATAGLYATPSSDPSDLLAQLQSSLGMQQLANELAEPILQVPDAIAAAQAAAESALRLLLKADALKVQAVRDKWILDATSTVDPATGKVTLLATAEISTDVEALLNSVQLQLGAMDGSIISHTSSLAVHGDRLNTAETDIAQIQGDIALTATESYVDGSINSALGAIDPANVATASQLGAEGLLRALLDADAGRRQALGAKASLAVAQLQLQSQADALVAEAVERLILSAQLGNAQAALVVEQLARATGDSALASSIATLLARLDTGDFAAVKTESSATADAMGNVEAKWGVQVQTMADGVRAAAGLQLLAGTDGESVFAILADKLLIYKPDGSGVPKQIVTLGNINGSTALGLDGNLIIDGSIVARSLAVSELSAITASIGTLRTATTGARVEIRDNVIKVFDAANRLRVKIGDLSL